MSYSLIIPIYNEDITLKKLLSQLNNLDDKIEIIIVNDGSTDNTKSILEQQSLFKIIHNPVNRGKGFSLIEGSKYASKNNLILMDGDLEIDLDCIPILIKKYESNSNTVLVGSRWDEKDIKWNKNHINTYGNFFINYIFNILYKTDLNDVLCCVKLLDKNLFNSLKLKSQSFSIEMEIMSKLAIIGAKIHEVDIVYNRRKSNQGKKLKISDSIDIIWTMIKIRFQ